MTQTLFQYYERELHYQHEASRDFATRFPVAAGRLRMDATGTGDPHVERLIQSFSLVAARVHKRLDDDLPEITDALLSILYPHYLRPIPSMAIVALEADPANVPLEGLSIPRGLPLRTSPVGGHACRYRTTQPTHLWPIELVEAALVQPPFQAAPPLPPGCQSALRLRFRNRHPKPFGDIPLSALSLHLTGPDAVTGGLYEAMLRDAVEVVWCSEGKPVGRSAAAEVFAAGGFSRDQSMLPYPPQSFLGYQWLTELFSFPEKFSFIELGGWDEVRDELRFRDVEIWVALRSGNDPLAGAVRAEHLRLGCTPVVNLYPKICEPIQFNRQKNEYRVVPDTSRRTSCEVYSVERVVSSREDGDRGWRPFFDLGRREGARSEVGYWQSVRRDSLTEGDNGTDVFLQLVDEHFDPCYPGTEVVTVHALCTDRDVPSMLRQHADAVTWHVDAAIPIKSVRCLKHPTLPLRPPLRRHAHWNLISHLALGHRFLAGPEGLETLREMLRLYEFSDPNTYDPRGAAARQMIEGIAGLRHRAVTRQVGPPAEGCFARGTQLTLVLDEDHFDSVGVYLFASVLERFLGLASGINSFVETVVETNRRDGRLAHFPPRSGEEPLQ